MRRRLAAGVIFWGVVVWSAVAWGEPGPPAEVTGELGVWSGYIFRGVPQYVDPAIASMQASVEARATGGAGLWGRLWIGTALAERSANREAGRTSEVDVSGGYGWQLGEGSRLILGGIAYLRPDDDPLDVREEVMLRWEGTIALGEAKLELRPYGALFGEVFRMLGGYGEVGVQARWSLEYGFSLLGDAYGGTSVYGRTGVMGFDVAGGRLGLEYRPWEELVIAGVFNAALTSAVIQEAPGFLDEHGVVWSGLQVRYSPSF